MGDLSKNFSRKEFACQGLKCCNNSAPVHPNLILGLQELRDKANSSIIITSGFRCIKHNSDENGSENSFHTLAEAADIKCPGKSIAELADLAETVEVFKNGGIGKYRSWLHVDVRSTGPARWES